MIPILATASRLVRAQTQALVHSPLLLERVVVALANAKPVAEVLIVFVVGSRLLRVDVTFGVGRRIQSQGARAGRRQTCRATVASEVALGEDFDELVFAVTLYRTRIADSCSIVWIGRVGGKGVAGKTRIHVLTERPKVLGAIRDALLFG